MANTQALTTAFKVDSMNGLHAFGASVVRAGTTKDAYKAALYLVTATYGSPANISQAAIATWGAANIRTLVDLFAAVKL